jgi:hypothetical protein
MPRFAAPKAFSGEVDFRFAAENASSMKPASAEGLPPSPNALCCEPEWGAFSGEVATGSPQKMRQIKGI